MVDPVVSIDSLKFCWLSGQRNVLEIPHFEVAKGEKVFLKGASGTGKTTLLSLIGGINTPQHGSIQILGDELSSMRQSQRDRFRADHIGFIFQLFNLIPYLSVLDNITLPCKFSKSRYDKAVQQSGSIEQEAKRLLAQLRLSDTAILKTSVTDLSVGQQQRVAAARALIGAPDILIADEPTSALDADTREYFIKLLLEESARDNTTVVFVSHDGSLEAMFDRAMDLSSLNKLASKLASDTASAVQVGIAS